MIDIRSLRSSFGPALRLAVMFVLTANAGARAPSSRSRLRPSERRDDTAGKSTTELAKLADCPGARMV